jgi:hypothetical protein
MAAIKRIRVSDLTGEEIGAEERLARIVVEEHPSLPDSVTLEVLPDEVEGKLPEEQSFVRATYYPSAESGEHPVLLSSQLRSSITSRQSRIWNRSCWMRIVPSRTRKAEDGEDAQDGKCA